MKNKTVSILWGFIIAGSFTSSLRAAHNDNVPVRYFLPDAAGSAIVTISTENVPSASASITILTQAVSIMETGPAATIKAFGEVYAFSPSFFMLRKDVPTRLEFWNLQPDDVHQFFLVGPNSESLLFVELPALRKTSYVLTFHREGLYSFQCPVHGAAMSGQLFVLPPEKNSTDSEGSRSTGLGAWLRHHIGK